MTRVGVFSDSHGDWQSLDILLGKMGHIDAACFLGDVAPDAQHLREKLAKLPGSPILYAVRGNNDFASALPLDLLIELGGRRIHMEHGHLCRTRQTLIDHAKERHADIALFGHTHKPLCEYAHGILLLNPGSAGNYCRGGRARASLLELDRQIRVTDVVLTDEDFGMPD